MHMEGIFSDDRAWPDAIQELLFGHELARRTGKNFDDLKCSSTDRYERAADPKFAAGKVDLALARGINRPNALFRHVRRPSMWRKSTSSGRLAYSMAAPTYGWSLEKQAGSGFFI